MQRIRIVLADDHGVIRQGLRSLLENAAHADFEVVGEAEDGQAAVDLALALSPDILLADVSMPKLNGIDATRKIVEANPKIHVIAVSGLADRIMVSHMLKAGARGYVLKEGLFDEVLEAIHTAMAGGIYLSPDIADVVENNGGRGPDGDIETPPATLSTRERKVLQLIGQGRSTKQIAEDLGISSKTVEACRRKIMETLNANSVADLVKIAISMGLTSID
jgi:two-component system response regulator NreC